MQTDRRVRYICMTVEAQMKMTNSNHSNRRRARGVTVCLQTDNGRRKRQVCGHSLQTPLVWFDSLERAKMSDDVCVGHGHWGRSELNSHTWFPLATTTKQLLALR